MKLAVIDHIGNTGGGSRVVRALLPALKSLRPDLDITYFGNRVCIEREGMRANFLSNNIRICELKSVMLANEGLWGISGSRKAISILQHKYLESLKSLPPYLSGAVHRELENKVKNFDLAYFPWPYMVKCPVLKCPIVGTFHDFNFHYYFSGNSTYTPLYYDYLRKEIPNWLKQSTSVVSTHFMAKELSKFYPEHSNNVEVVHLAPMSVMSKTSPSEAQNIVNNDLGINGKYILYPTNLCSHKNIGPLIASISLLKKMMHDITLVLTGPGVECINGQSCEIGVELGFGRQDVFGLGYVTNLQMDSLIQCASVVVSTSLYEAGNGPGLDAWGRGVPVAMSNIPAFLEHIELQGVKAAVFDPRSPKDIAEKIHSILVDPEKAKADAFYSQQALSRFTWKQTAEKYLAVFDKALKGGKRD